MKFADYLSKEEIKEFNKIRKAARNKKEYKPKRNKEKLSQRDLEELMGTHRETFERRRGALRRK